MNVVVQIEQTELTAWPIAPGALLLVGRSWQAVPEAGAAQLERRKADRGAYRSVSWSLDNPSDGMAFVAAVRWPASTTPVGGQSLALEDTRGGRVMLRLPAELAGGRDFAMDTAQWVGRHKPTGALVARFLLEMFPPSTMQRLPAIGHMLATLFAGLAEDDGCVELMGAIPHVCGFLQGWGGPVGSAGQSHSQASDGGVDALLVGNLIVRSRVRIATFARPDIVMPATGMVLVVDDSNGCTSALPSLEQVYLLGENAVLRRVVVERRLLNPIDSSGHIRDLLPALSCPPVAADCLRRALRPRYEGRETLGEQPLPVRAAVDQALLLPPEAGLAGGIYLTGWLFDPAHHVAEVILRDSAAFAARLDANWTRIERADVSEALTRDGFPPPLPGEHSHGFAVYVESHTPANGPLYLDFSFHDGTCAFLPLHSASARDIAARRRVLAGTDLYKASGLHVVEHQLGPFFLALMGRPANHGATLSQSPQAEKAAVALVVALIGPPCLPRSLLSQFLHDPLSRDEALVLVCGAEWNPAALATLRRTCSFMGLEPHVLLAPDATDAPAALDFAAENFASQRYLLLDSAAVGCRAGWRRVLRDAAEAAKNPAVICPTLLYEDLSVRFAGSTGMTTQQVAPYVSVNGSLSGMPAGLVEDGPPQATLFGSLACCLIPRSVLSAIGGARTRLASRFGQEAAFFQRVRGAGVACLWVPRAAVFAPDTAPTSAAATSVDRLVDGWCLRAAQERGLFAAKPASKSGV